MEEEDENIALSKADKKADEKTDGKIDEKTGGKTGEEAVDDDGLCSEDRSRVDVWPEPVEVLPGHR